MKKHTFPIYILVFLVSTSLGMQAQKSQDVSKQMQVPPTRIILCPDINVISLTAKLTKTSVSADGTQWDHVRLEATLQNDGGMAIPNGTMLQSKLYRNETVLFYIAPPANGVKAPGSRWTQGLQRFFPAWRKNHLYLCFHQHQGHERMQDHEQPGSHHHQRSCLARERHSAQIAQEGLYFARSMKPLE